MSNGELAGEPIVNAASDERFKQPGVIIAPSPDRASTDVLIRPLIIDAAEVFSIRLLVLHELTTTPRISAAGKIANIPKLTIGDKPVPSDWSWWRTGATLIGGVLIGVALTFLLLLRLISWVIDKFLTPGLTSGLTQFRRNEELALDAIRGQIKDELLTADVQTVWRLESQSHHLQSEADHLRQVLGISNAIPPST